VVVGWGGVDPGGATDGNYDLAIARFLP